MKFNSRSGFSRCASVVLPVCRGPSSSADRPRASVLASRFSTIRAMYPMHSNFAEFGAYVNQNHLTTQPGLLMVPAKATILCRARGEAWREKASGPIVALTFIVLFHGQLIFTAFCSR